MPQSDLDPARDSLPSEFDGIEIRPEDLALFAEAEDQPGEAKTVEGSLAEKALSLAEFKIPKPELSGIEEDDYTQGLREVVSHLDLPDGANVIYPGSATHVGVARVFGKENVVHVDPNKIDVGVLEEHGYKAVGSKIEEYVPESPSDAMVLLNSYGALHEADIERLLKTGGYVITNNHTHFAASLAELANLKLVGALLPAFGDENRRYYENDEIPEGATDIIERYYKNPAIPATAEDHDWTDDSPRYREGLFVFQKTDESEQAS